MPERGTAFAISAPSVFDGAQFLPDHCVIIRDGLVTQLLPTLQCPNTVEQLVLTAGILAPGLIDLQVNGGGDVLFNNSPCEETLATMLHAHRATGTTAFMPTVISDTREIQLQAVAAVRAAIADGNTGVLGVHLEGPYFAASKRGAHSAQMIRPATAEDIDWLCSLQDIPVIVTLAPEVTAPAQIRRLSDSGVQVCAGHSSATYAQMQTALTAGLAGVTHLFNAMSPLTSREPGVTGAALENDTLWAGIIADGHHVHPASIQLAQRSKPAGKLVLVSDAMATVGGSRGQFLLYGETIRESDGRLINEAGVLAGSAIGMIDAVRYMVLEVGVTLDECLRMASLYAAAILGLEDRLGRIGRGYRADLVHFDDNFAVHNTWVAGQHRRHR